MNVKTSGTPPDDGMLARLRRRLSGSCVCAAAFILCLFAGSRLLTDRLTWSQYCYWLPAWIYLAPSVVLLALSAAFWRQRTARRKLATNSLLGLVALAAGMSFLDGLPRKGDTADAGTLTIVHWNMSSPDMLRFAGTLRDIPSCRDADIILLGVTVPQDQFRLMVSSLGTQWESRRLGNFALVSRFPIRRARVHALGLEDVGQRHHWAWFQDFYNEHVADSLGFSRREFDLPDPGYVLDYVIESPAGLVTIRGIDLPSSPFRSRMEICTHAAQRIRALESSGALSADPQIVIGDFNIPGGSHSLKLLTPGLELARDRAQTRSRGATWPRARPLLDIDQAWIAPNARAYRYERFDAGISDHCGILVQIGFSQAKDR